MEIFRCGKEVVEILPIDLTLAGHEIDLTSGHEYKKIDDFSMKNMIFMPNLEALRAFPLSAKNRWEGHIQSAP